MSVRTFDIGTLLTVAACQDIGYRGIGGNNRRKELAGHLMAEASSEIMDRFSGGLQMRAGHQIPKLILQARFPWLNDGMLDLLRGVQPHQIRCREAIIARLRMDQAHSFDIESATSDEIDAAVAAFAMTVERKAA